MQNAREHSEILLTFIKLPFVVKTFVSSIFEWPSYTGFTVRYFMFTSSGKLRFRSDYADAQTDLNLLCMHTPACTLSWIPAPMLIYVVAEK